MLTNRKTTDGSVEIGGYGADDFERLRKKSLDLFEEKSSTIGEWVSYRVASCFEDHESLHQYKNRIRRLLAS